MGETKTHCMHDGQPYKHTHINNSLLYIFYMDKSVFSLKGNNSIVFYVFMCNCNFVIGYQIHADGHYSTELRVLLEILYHTLLNPTKSYMIQQFKCKLIPILENPLYYY